MACIGTVSHNFCTEKGTFGQVSCRPCGSCLNGHLCEVELSSDTFAMACIFTSTLKN